MRIGPFAFSVFRSVRCVEKPITLLYAAEDGGPILIEKATWKDINGVLLNSTTFAKSLFVTFRRHEQSV